MLEHLCILPEGIFQNEFKAYQYGQNLGNINSLLSPNKDLASPLIAIITLGEDLVPYQAFREALYSLSANFGKNRVVDLGGVKGGLVGITEVVDILLKQGIFPIVIGTDPMLATALYRAYPLDKMPLHFSIVDERLDYSWGEGINYLLDFLLPLYPQNLSRLNCLGYQSFFVDSNVLSLLEDKHFEAHRLGQLRASRAEIEPIVRDSDILGFNLSAISSAYSPGSIQSNPNGFSATESCQLLRYAAMSDRLSSIAFYGYCQEKDSQGISAMLLAQLVWYLVDGFYARKQEFPPNMEQLTRFVVQFPTGNYPITFFKSHQSERWWLYLPKNPHQELEPIALERLVSCSYEDYLLTCDGELPPRIFNAISRLG